MEIAEAMQVLRQALTQKKAADSRTQGSIAVLAEKMDQLKQKYPLLADMGFSREVERLGQQSAAAVC